MALLDIEGFSFSTTVADFYNYGLFTGSQSYVTLTTGTYGDPCLEIAALNSTACRAIPNTSNLFVGSRMALSASSSISSSYQAQVIFYDATSSTAQCSVLLDYNTGTVKACKGNNGTVLGTSASGLFSTGTTNNFFYLEIGVVIATGTGGSITVKINGTTVLTVTGVATQQSANAYVNQVQWVMGANYVTMALMHQYYCDNTTSENNTFLGDVRVVGRHPTAAGSETQFTPNGKASNYLNAATVPPVPATDYNSDATVGAGDLFTVAALPSGVTQVLGVQVRSLTARDSSGARGVANQLQSGSTTATGATVSVGTSFAVQKDTYQNDPNTGAAWTLAAANAVQPGYTIVS